MASLIPGFEYDIFISYRQKDNKGERWVSEFVDALKTELESTFKEEISVYFDINPSDYLLESYDVDASLKKKLKCLIFIPVISRTYCDPQSFAWDHEFKAFIEQTSHDQYGLKVALPNGNVAPRVLPVRIHDLDKEDMTLCESVTGGFLRGVEFIYKEPGVNRPLKPDDDEKINLNKTKYRNQINKVALAVKDIIESMKFSITHDQGKEKEVLVKEKKERKDIIIEEPVGKEIVKIGQGVGIEKIELKKENGFRLLRKSGILIPGILVTIILLGVFIFQLYHNSRIKWAEQKVLPEIEKLYNEENQIAAFNLIQKAEKYLSKNPEFQELASIITKKLTILTDPPGADIFIRNYSDTVGSWTKLGKTPIDSLEIPASTFYCLRIEKTGYENVQGIVFTATDTLFRKLFKQKEIPTEMVYVEGYRDEVSGNFFKEKNGFFLDRYEVTNKKFKEFVDKGGYRNPEYWNNKFIKDGKELNRDEAMTYFIDKTGRPGPAYWEAGDYPDGQDNYPVTGVSWYEAAAYAVYIGKSLPTSEHWGSGVGFYLPGVDYYFGSKILPLSNFNGNGPEPVGKLQGISCFGAYDMAGNVREWCWNETPVGHIIRGGAWNDASYLFSFLSQLISFDRSSTNGFRCVQYIANGNIPETAFHLIKYEERRDYSKKKPVPDNIFAIYKNQFLYDSTNLNAVIEEKINSYEDWTIDKITFNSAYGKERVIAYLFLPRNTSPPFQTLIYWHGLDATYEKDLIKSYSISLIDFLLKSGHAVMCPIYKGTFERIDEKEPFPHGGHQYTEWLIKCVKDFRRSIDYLETRSDIDITKLGFYGNSWGGMMGGIIPAVEDSLRVNILLIGGLWGGGLPEADEINYVSRVKIPTLMLNGKYDFTFPYESNVKPFFDLLGTPEKDKVLHLYNTDHYIPKSEIIKEVLAWCDKYLGPVKFKNQ